MFLPDEAAAAAAVMAVQPTLVLRRWAAMLLAVAEDKVVATIAMEEGDIDHPLWIIQMEAREESLRILGWIALNRTVH
jgi:hypothetical protein